MTTPTEAVAAAAAALDAHATPDYEAAEPGVGGPLLAADLDPTARRTKKARPAGGGGEEGGGGAGTGAPGGGGPGAPRPDGMAALSEGGLPGGPEGDADDMVRVVPVPKDSVLLREVREREGRDASFPPPPPPPAGSPALSTRPPPHALISSHRTSGAPSACATWTRRPS